MSWIPTILQLYSQVADLFGNVIVKRINIRLFDLLARFHYILNLPRMYLSNRYTFLYTESCIDDPEQVVSSPCVVSPVDKLACDAPATDDTGNFNDTVEVDSSSIDNLPTSESFEQISILTLRFHQKVCMFQI